MLVEFSVTNFRSIRDEQTISLVANAGREFRETHVVQSPAPATPDVLRSAIIYGANASGKSNLLRAIITLERLVARPLSGSRDSKLPFHPFLMDDISALRPTVFQVTFIEEGVRYQYGVSYNSERILTESLYAFPEGRAQRWFDRFISESGEEIFQFGNALKGQKKVWQDATRQNALFLSTAVKLNSEQLQKVFSWFDDRVQLIMPFARVGENYTAHSSLESAVRKKRVMEFLAQADLGISDFVVVDQPYDVSSLPDDAPESLRQFVSESLKDQTVQEISFLHRTSRGNEASLDLRQESGGTQKLFALAGPLIDTLENGYILLIDELDTSLHPLMLKYLVRLFHDPEINNRGAQILFTTHDTNVIPLFRRDQVWVMEKNENLESFLVPVSDFSPRASENIERGYLDGRFGGVPVIGRPQFWDLKG